MRKERLQKGKRAMAWLLAVSMLLGNESVGTAVSAQDQSAETVQEQIVEVADESIETVVLNNSGDVIISEPGSESGAESDAELTQNLDGTVGIEDIELLEGDEPEAESESESESEFEAESESEVKKKSEAENESEPKSESDAGNEPESENESASEEAAAWLETELLTELESESEIDMITVEAMEELADGEIISVTEEEEAEELYAMAGNGPLQQEINNLKVSENPHSITLGEKYIDTETDAEKSKKIIKETIIIPAGVSVKLNLNGYTLAPDDSIRTDESVVMNTISVYGTLTICDDSETKNGQIANADAAKNVRGIAVMKGGSVTLESGTITGFSNSGNGGGVIVEEQGSFTMNGGMIGTSPNEEGTITGNSVSGDGAGIYAYDGKNLQIKGGTITGNVAEGNGGGIGIYYASDTISFGNENADNEALQITGNTAVSGNGGGVWVKNSASVVNIGAGTYFGNTAAVYGGAFSFDGAVTSCNITGAIENNAAVNGGGIYQAAGELYVKGGTISGNTASEDGGGIYQAVGESNVEDGTISGNTASRHAGGIYCGTVTISGGEISGNTALQSGGGIYCKSGTMEGGTISGNLSRIANDTGGGGVCARNGKFTVSGGTISGNQSAQYGGGIWAGTVTLSGNAVIENNQAGSSGGGIHASTLTISKADSETDAAVLIQNNQGFTGGGIYAGSAQITGGTVSGNTAKYGGGMCLVGGEISGGKFSGNTATGSGGGIYVGAGEVKLSGNALITQNTASFAGGVYVWGTFNMEGATVTGNTADNGGGIGTADDKYTMEITGGLVYDNTAKNTEKSSKNGNDLYIQVKESAAEVSVTVNAASDFKLDETRVGSCWYDERQSAEVTDKLEINNTAAQVYCYTFRYDETKEAARIETTDYSTVKEAIANAKNGETITLLRDCWECIEIPGDAVIALDLNGYTLYGDGGSHSVIYVNEEAELTISDSSAAQTGTIRDGKGIVNEKDNYTYGGGLYVSGEVVLTGGTIRNNWATYGAGVHVSETGKFTMSGGSIRENSGGGVMVMSNNEDGGFTMSAGDITGNTGSGVWVSGSDAKFQMNGGNIKNNTSANGGGCYLISGTMEMTGGVISGNKALYDGGGIAMKDDATLTVTGGEITGNEAKQYGGAIWAAGCNLNLESGKIYGNTSGDDAQDIYAVFGVKEKTLTLFSASDMGREIYNCWQAEITDTTNSQTKFSCITKGIAESSLTNKIYILTASKSDSTVARIGTDEYSTLQEAVYKAVETIKGTGQEPVIYLTSDCTDSAVIPVVPEDKSVKVNLNGYTLSSKDVNAFYVYGGLTLLDKKDPKKDDYKEKSTGGILTLAEGQEKGRAVYVASGGSFTLESGTICGFQGMGYGGAVLAKYSKSVTISGGTLKENAAVYGGALCVYENGAGEAVNVSISGGSFEGNTADSGGAVWMDTRNSKLGHKLQISGGKFCGNKATAGDGGALWYTGAGISKTAEETADLSKAEFKENEAANASGGIHISNVNSITIGNISVNGNKALHNGGIYCAGNIITINGADNGAVISNNMALKGAAGGANFNGNITITNIQVKNNSAGSYGGGLVLSGNVNLQSGTISGNKAPQEGGIYANISKNAKFVMGEDVTVSQNTTCSGGSGISGGMGLYGTGTYELSGIVKENRALNGGGGISVKGSAQCTLKDITIEENKVYGSLLDNGKGGGILNEATVTVSGGTVISGNTAGYGGGIYSEGALEIADDKKEDGTVCKARITGNTASKNGGGIFVDKGTMTMKGGKISENTAGQYGGGIAAGTGYKNISITGGEISENTAGDGGGIYNTYNKGEDNDWKLEISGGVIKNNQATNYGGGVYNAGTNAVFKLTGGKLYDNRAMLGQDVYMSYTAGDNSNYLSLCSASAMFPEDEISGIGWLDEETNRETENAITDNPVAKTRALTLKYEKTVVAKIGEKTYTSVQAAVDDTESVEKDTPDSTTIPEIVLVADARESVVIPSGANIRLNLNGHTLLGMPTAITASGTLEICDDPTGKDGSGEGTGTITGTSVTSGGGIYVSSGGYVTLESGQISGCIATKGNPYNIAYGGSGVCIENGTFELAGGSINNCSAYHGAVYIKEGFGNFIMSGGEIRDNSGSDAGAVYVQGGLFQMTGGTISGNTSKGKAGGVYVNNGKVLLYGGEISENTAGEYGGGIFVKGGTVRLRGVKIAQNTVTDSGSESQRGGGGVYVENGCLYIYENTMITGNTSRRGGGIYQKDGEVHMSGGTITGNTADRGGGVAQYALKPGVFIMTKGQICGNTSSETSYGNDIYSAYEGSGVYENIGEDQKPGMVLAAAVRMEHEDYNVWLDDQYRKDESKEYTLEAKVIGNARYITGAIGKSNNLQLTASWYGDQNTEKCTTRMEVTKLTLSAKDGTGEFDGAVAELEKTAKDMLDANQAKESNVKYVLGENTSLPLISYGDKPYEQAQAVAWSPGNDSSEANNIVRTYDTVAYELTVAIGQMKAGSGSTDNGSTAENESSAESGTDGSDTNESDTIEIDTETEIQEPETLRLWISAELPCGFDEAQFSTDKFDYFYTDEKIEDGKITQVLYGCCEISNKGEGITVTKPLSLNIKAMKNGDTIKPVFHAWIEGNLANEETPKEYSAPMLTISAAPRYNVKLNRNTELAYTSYFDLSTGTEASQENIKAYEDALASYKTALAAYEEAVANTKDDITAYEEALANAKNGLEEKNVVYGTMLGYGITLSLHNNRQNMKGMELPDGPITFELTMGGSLYLNGVQVTDENGNAVRETPVIWAYKENQNTAYGSNISNTSFAYNMDWNDEDDFAKTTQYACTGTPLNSSGSWYADQIPGGDTDTGEDEDTHRVTMKFTVEGYSFDDLSDAKASRDFSAGYVQVIYPVDIEEIRKDGSGGYLEINMEAIVSDFEAESVSRQTPVGSIEENAEETPDTASMRTFFGENYWEHAKNEVKYEDNYTKAITGLYISPNGSGEGDAITKTNYYNDANDGYLSGDGGTGSAPIGSDAYIGGTVAFTSCEYDTTQEGLHYNKKFDPLTDNRLEYNYMTAMNLLQKFDADAYTPVGTKSAIVNQSYGLEGQSNSIADGAFIIKTTETKTTWSSKLPVKTQSYNLTILYAAKPDGSNWKKEETNADGSAWNGAEGETQYDDGGTADMDKYNEENLIYFTTLDELYQYFGTDENGNRKGHCVGILYQFRDCCIRTGRSISVHSKMNITDEFEKTGGTYATTNDARCWSTYRPTYKEHFKAATLSQVIQTFNWTSVTYKDGVYGLGVDPNTNTAISSEGKAAAYNVQGYNTVLEADSRKADSTFTQSYWNGYKKTQYENGSKVDGTHTGWYSGNSLLLYTMESSVSIKNTDKVRNGNSFRKTYNISNGDRTANFCISPKIQISSSVTNNALVMNGTQSTEVEITVTIPKHLYYTEGSVEFDYTCANCKYEEDELAWTIQKTENEDDTTTLVFRTWVSDIDKGLPEIHYGCMIGTPDDPERDIEENSISLTTDVKINTTYEETSRISCAANTDQNTILVQRDTINYITKTVEDNRVELGDDLVYYLNYVNYQDTGAGDSNGNGVELLDILPYNGDGRGTSFTGGYRVTGVELIFYDEVSYKNYTEETNGGILKIRQGEVANPDNETSDAERSAKQKKLLDGAEAGGEGWQVLTSPKKSDGGTDTWNVFYDLTDKVFCHKASDTSQIALFCSLPMVTSGQKVQVKVTLSPMDEETKTLITDSNSSQQTGNNVYWNNFIYRTSEIPVASGDVFLRTVERTISGLVWMDQDQDGIYSIGSGDYLSSDRLLRGINAALYTNSSAPLAAAVEKGYIAANEDGTWSPKKADGSVDTSVVYSKIAIDGATYYPAVDVLGNLVDPVETDADGSYSFKNLAAGNYIVVFSDENGYTVAKEANTGSKTLDYEAAKLPFSMLSVTPKRDTAVYAKPNQTTDKAVPNYGGKTDSSESGPAELVSAVITNGGDGIGLPELKEIQSGHYMTNRWNCGLYYIDMSVEKQWENTRSVSEGSNVSLIVTGTIGGTGSDSSEDGTASGSTGSDSGAGSGSDTPAVTYNAVIYTLTQQAAWNSVAVSKNGVSVPVNASTAITAGRNGMMITWKIANQYLQAEGAGPDGDGEKIVYSLTETAKDAEGNELKGYIKELSSDISNTDKKLTLTAKNTQVLFDLYIAKTSSSDSGSTEAGSSDSGSDSTKTVLKDAQYTLYTNEACTEQVSTSITGPQVSGTDGWFRFSNLEAGTWYMKETKAPSGYMLSKAIFEIQITWTGDPAITPVVEISQITDAETGAILETPVALKKTEVVTDDSGKQKIVGSGNYTVSSKPEDVTESEETTKYTISFSVEDECIYALPAAGGSGIYWNTLAGVALMLGALWLMDRRKRKAA